MTMKARMKVEILYDRKWWPGSVSKLLAKGSVEVVFDVDKNTLLVQCQDIATQLRSPQGTAALRSSPRNAPRPAMEIRPARRGGSNRLYLLTTHTKT